MTANRARLPGATLLGVDRFLGMLRIAARRGRGIDWVQGDGAHLPLPSASFDYATNQFSYHHMADRSGFFREVFRVLRPGGQFVLTNIDPWSMQDWAIYRFFPESQVQDHQDCLPAETLTEHLREIGFVGVGIERHMIETTEHVADILAYISDRHRTSQLMVISDEAYGTGVERARAALADGGEDATLPSEICLMAVTADRPPAG